jgi:hypothetical protein
MLGGAAVVIALAMGASPGTTSVIEENIVELLLMSPVLVPLGAVTVIVASLSSPWLPGRRHIKLLLLVAATVTWTIGFLILSTPGLLELP